MGIYAQKIEELLQDTKYIEDNVLHNYDNWTYHIKFYMIPQDSYKKYSSEIFFDRLSFIDALKIEHKRRREEADQNIISRLRSEEIKKFGINEDALIQAIFENTENSNDRKLWNENKNEIQANVEKNYYEKYVNTGKRAETNRKINEEFDPLYILSDKEFEEYSSKSLKKIFNESKKIVIAESGVTPGISIDSLSMTTYPPTQRDSNGINTTNLVLNITEVGSCSLMNKIALASYSCGYQSYTTQPYFIDIWFEGYETGANGEVITKKIPLYNYGGEIIDTLTYTVMMTVNSSIMENNTTKYKMSLYPLYNGSGSVAITNIPSLDDIEFKFDECNTARSIIETFEKQLNERIKNQYGPSVMDSVYHNENPFTVVYPEEMNLMQSEQWKKAYNAKYKEMNAIVKTYKSVRDFIRIPILSQAIGGLAAGLLGIAASPYLIYSGIVSSFVSGDVSFNMNNYNGIQGFLYSILTDYIHTCKGGEKLVFNENLLSVSGKETLNKRKITISYKPTYICDYNYKSYYSHTIYINFNEVPGLENIISDDPYYYVTHPSREQHYYLNFLFNNDLLKKRYKWNLNGENIDLLSLTTSENNLWYMNLGLSDYSYIDKQLANYKDIYGKQDINTNVVSDDYSKKIKDDYKKIEEINGTIFIDDLYELLNKNEKDYTKNGIKNYRNIALGSDANINYGKTCMLESDANNRQLAYDSIRHNLGMENIFQWGGQRMKVDMNIIGDPYWIFYSSDSISKIHNSLVLPHIILCTKSFYLNDENDEYKEDKLMNLNTVYMITEINSTFSGGKFIQKLKGFVATPFIQSSKGEDIKNEKQREIENEKMQGLNERSKKISKLYLEARRLREYGDDKAADELEEKAKQMSKETEYVLVGTVGYGPMAHPVWMPKN